MLNRMNKSNESLPQSENALTTSGNGRLPTAGDSTPAQGSPLAIAGQIANRAAGQTIFQRYMSEKAANTIKRQARDLELFAEYLLDIGLELVDGADFQTNPQAWRGITWGIVEGFVQWQLREGYAINSVNARLSTVKVYAQIAAKADVIARTESVLIQSVKGYSRTGGHNVDQQREQTRIEEVTYAYKPPQRRRSIVVTRRSTKKRKPTLLTAAQIEQLVRPFNDSPQAFRDALLLCLLLEHGLRASEAALLRVHNIDLQAGTLHFHRPKVQGTDFEWATHQLTPATLAVARPYLEQIVPPTLQPDGPLLPATTRLRQDGSGGALLPRALNRVRISERIAWLGKRMGLEKKLSAHDCRHTCATRMARLGYAVDELMAWFGWTNAQTAMRYVTAVDVQIRHKG